VATFQLGAVAHVLHRVHVLRDQQHVPQMDRDFRDGDWRGVLRVRSGGGKHRQSVRRKRIPHVIVRRITFSRCLSSIRLARLDRHW